MVAIGSLSGLPQITASTSQVLSRKNRRRKQVKIIHLTDNIIAADTEPFDPILDDPPNDDSTNFQVQSPLPVIVTSRRGGKVKYSYLTHLPSLMRSPYRLNMIFSLNGHNIKRTICQSYSHMKLPLSAFIPAPVDPVPTPFLLATIVRAHPVTADHVCFPSIAGCHFIESKGGMVALWKIFHFQNLGLLLFSVMEVTSAQG
jgi:hypothetical protein